MNVFVVVTVSTMVANLISSESTKEPSNGIQQPLETSSKDFILKQDGSNLPRTNSLWVYRPAAFQESHQTDEIVKRLAMKPPSLTKLAKTLTLGFDPFFNKGYFGPFERRRKPVTLVAFRKNGLLPRSTIEIPAGKSAEIAELQSPFNDISSFWTEDGDLTML